MMKRALLLFVGCLVFMNLLAQDGIIKGKVISSINNNPVPFATVGIASVSKGTVTTVDGDFELSSISPGLYNIQVSCIGFIPKTIFEVKVNEYTPTVLEIVLEEQIDTLEAVVVTTSPFNKTEESPISLRTIGSSEIDRNPGGNRDISKVIQSLPGVSSTVSFRNDIIIRGGAPNENRFYLDGIEVPNINHFATQGASGGPVGMINVNFIREVDFYSGAFPADRGNALSSVFDFKQKDGNTEKLITTTTIGSSDFGITLDGPINQKTTFISSVRRSYLGWLFKALELPFLPTYYDAQFKVKTKFDAKNQLSIIGLGAIDDFELNLDANETEKQQFTLGNLPVNKQWNYVLGANYKHFYEKSYLTLVASRNHLNNKAYKYQNNDESDPSNKILDYVSQEVENKFRVENKYWNKGYKVNMGAGVENVLYTNATYKKITLPTGNAIIDFDSELRMNKFSLFAQGSKSLYSKRLILSLGLRTDFTDYSSEMSNPLKQLSPRFSLAYNITDALSFNFNTGRYYQLPSYTVLGYRDSLNTLVNKQNKVSYIGCDHIVAGFEYNTTINTKVSIEGFYKMYSDYPLTLRDSITLANLGGNFGVIGNEPVVSASAGKSLGFEVMVQQKLYKGFYGIVSYTFVKSEFQDKNKNYVPSAWDNGNILSLTFGKKFKNNWELGLKWRYQGGSPYTPIDVQTSSLISVWDINGQGVLDYSLLNSQRLKSFHQLDMRIDKKFFVKKWSLDVYIDIQNVYGFAADTPPELLLDKDADGNAQIDPANPASYLTKFVYEPTKTVLPTLGLIFEF